LDLTTCPSRDRLPALARTLALAAAAIAGALAYPLLARAAPAVGSAAPDFAVEDTAGHNERLSEYRGEVVLLTFWASNCGACRDSLAQVNGAATELGSDSVVAIGVSLDGEPARAASVAGSLGLKFTNLVDTRQSVGRLYDVSHLPLTLLIDHEGVVRETWAREPVAAATLVARIRGLER
jgi:peroxiredoxin